MSHTDPTNTASRGAPTPTASTSPTARDPYFDNARGILITLVVLGHALLEVDGHISLYMSDVIYSFHMPAFIVVSGYLARNAAGTRKDATRLVGSLLVPYLIFQTIHNVLDAIIGGGTFTLDVFTPRWTLWFLLALFFWRLLVPVFRHLRFPLAFAIAVSVLAPLSQDIGTEFSSGRVLSFLPFFIAGTILTPKAFAWLTDRPRRYIAIAGFTTLTIVLMFLRDESLMRLGFFLGRHTYEQLDLTSEQGMAIRIGVLILGAAGTAGLLALTPRNTTYLTTMGQRSLYIYLLHGIVLWPMRYTDLPPAWLGTTTGNITVIIGSILLAMLLGSRPVVAVVRPLVEPRVGWLFDREAPAAAGSVRERR
ncbi:acyltransferase family protein [Jonesia quinghaiensis]|uniref:acyltransferase family protein n=1 Tax=Jonesia quinghaiensis TaxID=262806 RepID=UPI000427798C|nr:acyltransferase family protein [Jonesia quinghaiensis]